MAGCVYRVWQKYSHYKVKHNVTVQLSLVIQTDVLSKEVPVFTQSLLLIIIIWSQQHSSVWLIQESSGGIKYFKKNCVENAHKTELAHLWHSILQLHAYSAWIFTTCEMLTNISIINWTVMPHVKLSKNYYYFQFNYLHEKAANTSYKHKPHWDIQVTRLWCSSAKHVQDTKNVHNLIPNRPNVFKQNKLEIIWSK